MVSKKALATLRRSLGEAGQVSAHSYLEPILEELMDAVSRLKAAVPFNAEDYIENLRFVGEHGIADTIQRLLDAEHQLLKFTSKADDFLEKGE